MNELWLAILGSSAATTGLLAVLAWLCREWIVTRLTSAVQHGYDAKLEAMRSELRRSEEVFRLDLSSKEAAIVALRSSAMTALTSRRAAFDKRQLEAIDQLWDGVNRLAKGEGACMMIGLLKYDACAQEAAKSQKFRDFLKSLPGDMSMLEIGEAMKARPHISEMAWALFSAYMSVIGVHLTKLQILRTGLESPPDLVDSERVVQLVKVALPHRTDYLSKYGDSSLHLLLSELRESLLTEIRRMIDGKETDEATVQRAAAITKAAEALRANLGKQEAMPTAVASYLIDPEAARAAAQT